MGAVAANIDAEWHALLAAAVDSCSAKAMMAAVGEYDCF